MRIYCLGLLVGLMNISCAIHAESIGTETLFNTLDQDGMHISVGVRRERSHVVLWSHLIAQAYNPNGFITNDFIPFCQLSYTLTQEKSHWHQQAVLAMRLTSDGPEYGRDIYFHGAGNYQLSIYYQPPVVNGFYRHIDKATGVAPWWHAFTQHYRFYVNNQGQLSQIQLQQGEQP
ncbi:iron transporter [Celerinatantimonas yamalensis]|uniref:Iron transporter n=1 Tax=Celerinatantimonas yamalensis TaxID=559956 RepID=A0ABW9G4I4_9GAMM